MKPSTDLARVYQYHDGTKHSFHQFARSLGYLDWASQPRPFRSYAGADAFAFEPHSRSAGSTDRTAPGSVPHHQLCEGGAVAPAEVTVAAIGDLLRHALGLSAWKLLGTSRWALRVNPSSGNLHPTEAYIVTGPLPGLSPQSGVWHYAPESHAIERRCAFAADAWPLGDPAGAAPGFLVALASIHWRESWKYGERGFRYCQHDLGHAIGALSVAAAIYGWRLTLQPGWSHQSLSALIGIDRDDDYVDAEREEPGCLMLVSAGPPADLSADSGERLVNATRGGRWSGQASQLSEDHVQWTFIDDVAAATGDLGNHTAGTAVERFSALRSASPAGDQSGSVTPMDTRQLVLQRRSAVALDGISSTDRASFSRMLARALPCASVPWTALWWTPRIHLAIFVHRVTGLAPGLYLLLRDHAALPRLRAAFNPGFAWTLADEHLPLYLLDAGPMRSRAQRLSCDQAIAADGFFSLGMIADFDRSLNEHGSSFYRQLFWESGVIGQSLYLAAEAAGARGTGIGCFYDEPVHEMLGLKDHAFQSLYHFTVGMPVEDRRLTTEPGYSWER